MLPKTILLLADVFAIVCLARFILQWAKLSHSHPLAHFYSQTTDWLVSPLRKIVPPFKQWVTHAVNSVQLNLGDFSYAA